MSERPSTERGNNTCKQNHGSTRTMVQPEPWFNQCNVYKTMVCCAAPGFRWRASCVCVCVSVCVCVCVRACINQSVDVTLSFYSQLMSFPACLLAKTFCVPFVFIAPTFPAPDSRSSSGGVRFHLLTLARSFGGVRVYLLTPARSLAEFVSIS